MAFYKEIPNDQTGHINTYWRVTGITVDALFATIRITLSGYASAAARQEGKMPDSRRDYNFGSNFHEIVGSAPVGNSLFAVNANAAYSLIRNYSENGISEFGDALDV